VAREVTDLVEGERIEALAIGFLHSYRDARHERRAGEIVRRLYPGLALTLSAEVAPEIREYERTSTACANAYVQPRTRRYLDRLEAELARIGFGGRLYVMLSGGGIAAVREAKEFPIRLIESGPAAGAMAAAFLAKLAGLDRVVSYDMGGTTAKMCLVEDGSPDHKFDFEAGRVRRFVKGSGMPLKVSVVDMIEIGAGGGSIARVEPGSGLMKVGPRSAGAKPGPVCYGRGGTEPCVTDADLMLGRLDPAYFLGGEMALEPDRVRRAFADGVAARLGLSVMDAALGVQRIVDETMAAATRMHLAEKGRDPRQYALIAFGGAGPVVAGRVARVLGAGEVIVPPVSGVASALGLLVAPASFEFSRSYPAKLHTVDWAAVNRLYTDMEQQARQTLASAGVAEHAVHLERRAEMRLSGQFHDIEVIIPSGPLAPAHAPEIAERFAHEYERLYHAVLAGYEILILNWRLRASGPHPEFEIPAAAVLARSGTQTRVRHHAPSSRPVYFAEVGGFVATTVYDRYHLRPGERIVGPAIVEERESTTILAPGDALTVDAFGNLRISVGGRA
jgi:N-methylhydantoinase A